MGDDTDVEVGQVRGAKEDSRVNRWQGAQERPHMHGSRMLCGLVRWRIDGNRYKNMIYLPKAEWEGLVGTKAFVVPFIQAGLRPCGESPYDGASDNTFFSFFFFLIGLLGRGSMVCGGPSVRDEIVMSVGGGERRP